MVPLCSLPSTASPKTTPNAADAKALHAQVEKKLLQYVEDHLDHEKKETEPAVLERVAFQMWWLIQTAPERREAGTRATMRLSPAVEADFQDVQYPLTYTRRLRAEACLHAFEDPASAAELRKMMAFTRAFDRSFKKAHGDLWRVSQLLI